MSTPETAVPGREQIQATLSAARHQVDRLTRLLPAPAPRPGTEPA